jgi:hypothetical protein
LVSGLVIAEVCYLLARAGGRRAVLAGRGVANVEAMTWADAATPELSEELGVVVRNDDLPLVG